LKIKAGHILSGINCISGLLILVITFLPVDALRIIFGLPFVLFFPGYTLMDALYPRKSSIKGIERIALSVGLSIAIVPLIGLILNYLPWGIRLYPILISLTVFTAGMSLIAWLRGRRFRDDEKVSLNISIKHVSLSDCWNAQSRGAKVMSVVLILLVLTAVGTLVYVARMPRHIETYTEFYLLNEDGMADSYPTSLKAGESANVIIGITNHEGTSVDYRVEVLFNGQVIDAIGPVTLDSEQNHEQILTLGITQPGEHQKMELLLYKDAETEIYETLHLWMNVSEE
jgi:uncharacterized membrane protein